MKLNTLTAFEAMYNTNTSEEDNPSQWLHGKTVLLRVDFNVPLDSALEITDDNRITAAIPTIEWLKSRGAVVVLMSHLGRPKGTKNSRLSLLPVAKRLQSILDQTIYFCDVMDEPETLTRDLKAGDIVLLENLRFEPGEEQNDDRFAQKLAMIGDFYVNDAFGLVHRAHASVHALAKLFHHKEPSNNKAFAGLLIEQESAALDVVLDFKSKSHSVAVLGGSKVSDKIVLIDQLARRSKNILVGGAMGYTLMRAKRIEVGNSRVENDKLSIARQVLETCEKMKVNLHLPIDHVCKSNFDESEEPVLVNTQEIPEGLMGLDIGPKTRAQYAEIIRSAQCVFWNGPMGVFEWEGTAEGTRAVGLALNECTKNGGYTVIGGGDSAAAANQMGLTEHISHVSTGGGASLTYLEQNGLPGLEFLEQKKETIHD